MTEPKRARLSIPEAWTDKRVKHRAPGIGRHDCRHLIIVQGPGASWCGACGKRAC
jgi:hypothetical protein